jgi:hypothetical protein
MRVELDHVFVCTAPGAPEAEEFVRFGLREGSPNRHPGQGTASRRFAFANAMIELVWVDDAEEARSECSRPTQLWERWTSRAGKSSPFGICVRPVDSQDTESPFPAWKYRPSYLPDPLVMHVGEAGVEEPMWVYLGFMRRVDREQWFVEHPIGLREITNLTLTTPCRFAPPRLRAWSRVEFFHLKMGQNPSSKSNSTAAGAKRLRISDRICRSSFNFDSSREIRPSTALRQDSGGSRANRTLPVVFRSESVWGGGGLLTRSRRSGSLWQKARLPVEISCRSMTNLTTDFLPGSAG